MVQISWKRVSGCRLQVASFRSQVLRLTQHAAVFRGRANASLRFTLHASRLPFHASRPRHSVRPLTTQPSQSPISISSIYIAIYCKRCQKNQVGTFFPRNKDGARARTFFPETKTVPSQDFFFQKQRQGSGQNLFFQKQGDCPAFGVTRDLTGSRCRFLAQAFFRTAILLLSLVPSLHSLFSPLPSSPQYNTHQFLVKPHYRTACPCKPRRRRGVDLPQGPDVLQYTCSDGTHPCNTHFDPACDAYHDPQATPVAPW